MFRVHALFLGAILAGRLAAQGNAAPTPLAPRDSVLIAEAYHLWSAVADGIWPGASRMAAPMVYLTDDNEYAIGFPGELKGFSPVPDTAIHRPIQARKRTLQKDLSASFPFEGTDAAVLGTPEALGKNTAGWVVTAAHEMFHVFQYAHGSDRKIASLEIGPPMDASWQLTFPFPYQDADVMRLIHLQGYPLWLAATAAPEDAAYNVGTALDAVAVYHAYLDRVRPDGRGYRYSQFQEWNEGVAAYTEYRVAERAANGGYQPTAEFAVLPGVQTYQQLWERIYRNHPFLVKHAGRAAQSRTAFYHLGMGKALALDRISPGWKDKYFAPGVWLDDLLAEAVKAAQ